MFRPLAPDASEDGVAVFVCGEANGHGGKSIDSIESDAAEQYVLPDAPGKICETHIVHGLCVRTLRKKTTVVDESRISVEEEGRLSKGGRLVQNVRNGDHLPVGHEGAGHSCLERDRRISGKASPVNLGVIDGLAKSPAVETVVEEEKSIELAIDR